MSDSQINSLRLGQEMYSADPVELSNLGQVNVVPIFGPVAVGKSTLLTQLPSIDERFGSVVGFTTRPPIAKQKQNLSILKS